MDTEISDVIISLNGRDKDKFFIVVGKEDNYSFLVDGKRRKLEKPKKKKNKHIKHKGILEPGLALKLINGEKTTNKEIRKALAEYNKVYDEERRRDV